jgi:hypothetical protein
MSTTRSNMSYAERLRRELVAAGVDRYELPHETATTLPVDFHSTRRAYATALVRSGDALRREGRLALLAGVGGPAAQGARESSRDGIGRGHVLHRSSFERISGS